MKKSDVVAAILGNHQCHPENKIVRAFAPVNIALCKYWGKRNEEINLPVTSSLSVSLRDTGSHIELSLSDMNAHQIFLNGAEVLSDSSFYQRLVAYFDLFRKKDIYFRAEIQSDIPIAAGLASSASGFASVILALDQLYQWQLSKQQLSILARLGSGSACRSLWDGFVEWQCGNTVDGMDSHGVPLADVWPDFAISLCVLDSAEKPLSSREAMRRTVNTSVLYRVWPEQVRIDMEKLKHAICYQDFELLGKTAESNALVMHATMLSASPAVIYALPETLETMQKIWQLRAEGLPVYFTQDAGPNLKLLHRKSDATILQEYFDLFF